MFLIAALIAIVAIKRMGGFSLAKLFNDVAPRPRPDRSSRRAPYQHLEVETLMATGTPMAWVVFGAVVVVMLALDLGVFHRKAHVIRAREAAVWSLVWISVALLFNLGIYFQAGGDRALEFFQAWLIEKALSVDNLFVFLVAFSYFAVPAHLQHRVLFWGIIGALITRGIFIAIGAALLAHFHLVIYIFGAFLIFTAVRLMRGGDEETSPREEPRPAPVPALRAAHARVRRHAVLRPPERSAVRDARC